MMRWKVWLVGALALAGLATTQSAAEAKPIMAQPALMPLQATEAASGATEAPTCYWRRGYYHHYGWHRWHYGYRPHYWHRRYYGWHRPYYHHRHYGFYRPAYYGWHRPWGYRRHWGWHHHYGWHRHWGWHHRYGW